MASYSGFRNLSLNLKHLSDLVLRLNFLEKYLHLKVPENCRHSRFLKMMQACSFKFKFKT